MFVRFCTVVLGTLLTVIYFNPFLMTVIATAAAITVCMHLYFIEIEIMIFKGGSKNGEIARTASQS